MVLKYIFIGILAIFPLSSYGEQSSNTYLCISEESTGFYYEKGQWGHANFNVKNDKFILREIKVGELGYFGKENSYGIFPIGERHPELQCGISESENNFVCQGLLGQFYFSPKSGRFIKTYIAGYWDGKDNNENTPAITRGRCSKI